MDDQPIKRPIYLPSLHPAQIRIVSSPARFKVIAAGRRFGKGVLTLTEWFKRAINGKKCRWIAPSYQSDSYQAGWSVACEMANQISPNLIHLQKRMFDFSSLGGGWVQFRTAEEPDCHDAATEILTRRGWLPFAEVTAQDEVMTRKESGLAEWQIPSRIIAENYEGKIYHLVTGKLDVCVTPKHRFRVIRRRGEVRRGKWNRKEHPRGERLSWKEEWTTAENLTPNDALPALANWHGQDDDSITENHCALMGFYLAEGSAYGNCGGDITKRRGNYSVVFAQTTGNKGGNKGDVRSLFKPILSALGYRFSESKIGLCVLNKALWQFLLPLGNKYTKRIPEVYKNLPPKKLRVLIQWLLLGDGSTRNRTAGGLDAEYYSVSKRLADDFQEIAIKAGWSAKITMRPPSRGIGGRFCGKVPLYTVRLHHTKFRFLTTGRRGFCRNEIDYSGKIYCVSVPNGIVLTRRNGIPAWTGNSLRGEGIDAAAFDEAAHIPHLQEIWEQCVRPSLMDRKGDAWFISTPCGFNYFNTLYNRGRDKEKDWESFHFVTCDNPTIDPAEIEALKKDMPALVARQEIDAEFVQLAGALFRRNDIQFLDEEPKGLSWVRSWDLAFTEKTTNDCTAGAKITVNLQGDVIVSHMVKGRMEWPDAIKLIAQIALMDGPTVRQGIEVVGAQVGMLQTLLRDPLLVNIPFHPIEVTRDKLTRALPLVARAERHKLFLVRGEWNKDFIDELMSFPSGTHDDQVDGVTGGLTMLTERTGAMSEADAREMLAINKGATVVRAGNIRLWGAIKSW